MIAPASDPPLVPITANPRPLALHLSLQTLTLLSALSALPLWKAGSLNLKDANGKNLLADAVLPANLDEAAFTDAVTRQAIARLIRFSDGIAKYHACPRIARPPEPPVIWSAGSTRVMDYGVYSENAAGPPVVVIPSLINRSYILDLYDDRSLLRYLAKIGLRPLLVDWGQPGYIEQPFGLDAYIADRLCAILAFAQNLTSSPPAIVGYCMGGNMALALAAQNPAAVSSLALLATPWNFHLDGNIDGHMIKMLGPALDALIAHTGELPPDVLQALFAILSPALTGAKFRQFTDFPAGGKLAQRFTMLEDWVNDGIPLTANVARDCLFGWYRDNTPFYGRWKINGEQIDPAQIAIPTFLAIPSRDHIVPPQSARALADVLPNTVMHTPDAGHIGMVVGSRARQHLYKPLGDWLICHQTGS